MNLKCLRLVLIVTIITAGFATEAQELTRIWETDSTLMVPESVFFDKKNKVLYVSNIDGEPWGKDGKGSIGKVGLDGKILEAEWVTGLSAPKGMGLHNNTLYVADMGELVAIDIKSGKITKRIAVDGAEGLNDVSVDKSGVVYVTDSRTKKVHRVQNGTASLFLENLKGPNGVLVHNNSIYVLDAGGMYKVEKDKSLKMLAEGMEGGTDGVEHVKGNEFIVSCWGGVIYYVNGDGTKKLLLDSRDQKINSADIGYDAAKRIVYVPTFFKNSVVAYQLK